jgi:acyl-CoA thioesterase FadM
MGNILSMRLEVKQIGTSSVTLAVSASTRNRECVRATLKVVHTSLSELRAVPFPVELRESMQRFQRPVP